MQDVLTQQSHQTITILQSMCGRMRVKDMVGSVANCRCAPCTALEWMSDTCKPSALALGSSSLQHRCTTCYISLEASVIGIAQRPAACCCFLWWWCCPHHLRMQLGPAWPPRRVAAGSSRARACHASPVMHSASPAHPAQVRAPSGCICVACCL
jgi:hypothetical protein